MIHFIIMSFYSLFSILFIYIIIHIENAYDVRINKNYNFKGLINQSVSDKYDIE